MRHLIDTTDISVAEVDQILETALDIIANRKKYSEACKGKKLATLFYEPSTRTRLSFTSAMMELGGNVLGFSDAASSSVSKGETVADTVRVIGCFADIIAMRHNNATIATGEWNLLDADDDQVYAFTRTSGDDTILVIVNVSDKSSDVPTQVADLLAGGINESQVLLSTYDAMRSVKSIARGELARWEGVVIQL